MAQESERQKAAAVAAAKALVDAGSASTRTRVVVLVEKEAGGYAPAETQAELKAAADAAAKALSDSEVNQGLPRTLVVLVEKHAIAAAIASQSTAAEKEAVEETEATARHLNKKQARAAVTAANEDLEDEVAGAAAAHVIQQEIQSEVQRDQGVDGIVATSAQAEQLEIGSHDNAAAVKAIGSSAIVTVTKDAADVRETCLARMVTSDQKGASLEGAAFKR